MVKFSELQRLESDVLNVIRNEGVFQRLNSLVCAAHGAKIVTNGKSRVNVHLSFTLPTRLREDKGGKAVERDFHVGCLAEAAQGGDDISQLSYSVLIGKDAPPSKLIARKFHFDFEPAARRDPGESKPTFHMQICGKLSEHHQNFGYTDDHIAQLLPAWSKPRIPAQPMSLALVLNWLFIEFGSESPVRDARVNDKWRKLVRDAERKVLRPYYQRCADFLEGHANDSESFYTGRLYEEGGSTAKT